MKTTEILMFNPLLLIVIRRFYCLLYQLTPPAEGTHPP